MTIQEAAQESGWSPRMLRYIERAGLLEPVRTDSGYRDYTQKDVQRLRSLKQLIAEFSMGVGEIAFAVRLVNDPGLRTAIEEWVGGHSRPIPARKRRTCTRAQQENQTLPRAHVSQQPNTGVMERT